MRAEGRIAELKATFDDAFETCDLIMSPVSCFPAFPNEAFPAASPGTRPTPCSTGMGRSPCTATQSATPPHPSPPASHPMGCLLASRSSAASTTRRLSWLRPRPSSRRGHGPTTGRPCPDEERLAAPAHAAIRCRCHHSWRITSASGPGMTTKLQGGGPIPFAPGTSYFRRTSKTILSAERRCRPEGLMASPGISLF